MTETQPAAVTAESVLREALDQYVTNQDEFVERDEGVTDADRAKLAIAGGMLDVLNAGLAGLAGLSDYQPGPAEGTPRTVSNDRKNVKLGNGTAVHALEDRSGGARCNRNYLGGRVMRVRMTSDPITCAKCRKITAPASHAEDIANGLVASS